MLDNFCGCSLLFGVEIIALNQILYSVLSLSLTSSKDELVIGGVVITPTMEVAYASWCLLGIPLAIGAGVGALYQMPFHLNLFTLYLVALFIAHLLGIIGALASGVICGAAIAPEVQRLGQHFVCAFVDTFAGFWGLIILSVQAYCIYAVRSAAVAISERNKYPELLAAADRLRSLPKPERPPPYESVPYVPTPNQPMQMPVPMQMQVPQPPMPMMAAMAQSQPAQPMARVPGPVSPMMVQSMPIRSQPQPMSEPLPGMHQSAMASMIMPQAPVAGVPMQGAMGPMPGPPMPTPMPAQPMPTGPLTGGSFGPVPQPTVQ